MSVQDIDNVVWVYCGGEKAKITFEYKGQSFQYKGRPCSFREPRDVVLLNDERGKRWIWQHYGWLLTLLD